MAEGVRGFDLPTTIMISRRGLHDELVTILRNMIVGGELRPGERIYEQALCQRFGVSRTPLREALKVISAEGLVRLLPNRGATVVRMTRKEAEEVIPLIGALEAFAAGLACVRIGDEEIARIERLHNQMIEDCSRGEAEAYFEVYRAIHAAIVEATGNVTLIDVYHILLTRLRLILAAPKLTADNKNSLKAHEQIIEALRSRDGLQLSKILGQQVVADLWMALQ